MVIIREIETATTTIPFIPVPAQIINMGASAVLGKAFKTTKKGSNIFARVLLHHKIIAINMPKLVPITSPKIVS